MMENNLFIEFPSQMESSSPEGQQDIRKGFAIHDDLTAEWAIRKISAERAESQRLNSVRRAVVEQYAQDIADEDARCARRCAHLEQLLADYFATVPHKQTKTQETYSLPSGKLVMKQPPTQFKRDDAALGEWLKASGYSELVEAKLEPKWGELKKRGVRAMEDGRCVYEETGEIISGVTAAVPAPVFQVIVRDAQ